MIELNYSTAKGKQIYARGSQHEGYKLTDVYNRPSIAKIEAFDKCLEQYLKTEDSTAFSICSHNKFMFTCSWLGKLDGENIMRYETANYSYLVWLDR